MLFVIVSNRRLCISFKLFIEILIKQHTFYFAMIINDLQRKSGLKNAGDFYRLRFCFYQFYIS